MARKSHSRASRAAEQAQQWRDIADSLTAIKEEADDALTELQEKNPDIDELPEKEAEVFVKRAQEALSGVDTSELDSLKDEISSWKSNLEGTNLENSNKYQMLDEAESNMDNIDVGSVSVESLDDIETAVDELNNAADELEQVEFPGMYS